MIGLRIGNEDKRLNVEVYFFQPLFYIPLRCIPLLLSKLCWGIFSKTYPSFLTLKEGVFSKITPSLFVDKASCTRQFESELSLHSLASLFPLKEGSTSHPDPLSLRGEGGNRPTRCSEPLRSKVGGPKRSSPYFAGWDRLGIAVYSLQLIVNSLRLISWLFADNLQISC